MEHTNFRPKSTFIPFHLKGSHLEAYYQVTYRDLLKSCDNKSHGTKPNLSDVEFLSMRNLKNQEIVIKQADKGGSLVIQNKKDYLKESYRLSDPNTYVIC